VPERRGPPGEVNAQPRTGPYLLPHKAQVGLGRHEVVLVDGDHGLERVREDRSEPPGSLVAHRHSSLELCHGLVPPPGGESLEAELIVIDGGLPG
jgi:hypothetical protein